MYTLKFEKNHNPDGARWETSAPAADEWLYLVFLLIYFFLFLTDTHMLKQNSSSWPTWINFLTALGTDFLPIIHWQQERWRQ